MQEYHVDCHPEFFAKYVTLVDCQKFGRNLLVRIPNGTHLKLLIGQDECIIKENLFSSKQWNGSEGQSILRPKDDGHSWMISAFVSRAFSFNVEEILIPDKLEVINARQQNHNYISIKSAWPQHTSHESKVGRCLSHYAPNGDIGSCVSWTIPQDPCYWRYANHDFPRRQ